MKKYAVIKQFSQSAATNADQVIAECETEQDAINEAESHAIDNYHGMTDEAIQDAWCGERCMRLCDASLVIVCADDFPNGTKPGLFDVRRPRSSDTKRREIYWNTASDEDERE